MSMFPLPTILKRILPLAAALALILAGGCTDQSVPSEPLPGQAADGAVLAGTVTDTGGARAADAVIVVEPLVAGVGLSVARSTAPDLAADRDPDKSGGVRTAVSDGQGRFALPELAAGAYVVTTTLRDHAGDSRTVTISAALADKADTTFVDIALTPTGTLAGVATLENAILHDGTVVYVEGTSYLAVTDGAGAYAMTGVPVGTWNVRAFHAGYLDDATTGSLAIAAEVDTLPDLFLPLESNIAPIVDQIDATPLAAGQPTAFVALAHDPDGTVVRWEWDFENDGVWDYDSALTGDTGFAYAVVGPVTAKLRVTDDGGAIGLGAISFEVPAVSYAGIFVATTGDDANTGAHDDPLLTIGAALGLANQQGATDIWVETGVYTEFVTLPAGLGVHGGRVPPTWDRGPGQYSRLTGDVLAAGALGVNQPTLIEGMEFVAVDATDPGQASVAMTVFACTSALVFDDCIFAAGNGADGADGTDGVFGPNGQNGGNGAPGACDNIISAPGGLEGGGGWAGGPGGSGGQGAAAGENGWASSAAPGGQGGASGNPGQAGQNGFNGPDGGNGFGGTAAAPYGSLSISLWVAGVSGGGIDGDPGEGGGGGGGGGGNDGTFVIEGTGNGGGGGGGGGFGGYGGGGGQGGGASICVVIVGSSPTFTGCTFTMGDGGNGGLGGGGAVGGAGGSGGFGATACLSEVGRGGNGGAGGDGGDGGGGAGGPGGPCFGFYAPGVTLNLSGATYQAGTPGTGGTGGAGAGAATSGQDGPDGVVGNVYN